MNFSTALIFAFIFVAFQNLITKEVPAPAVMRHHHKHEHHHHTFHPRRSTSTTTTTTAVYKPSTEAPLATTSARIATVGGTTTILAAEITTELEPITRAEVEASTKLFPDNTTIAAEVVTKVAN